MNDKNPAPFQAEEERKKSAKDGIGSGAVRRRKRDLRAAMKELLELPVTDTELWNSISALGIDPKNINNCAALVTALFAKASRGDVAAFKEIRSLMSEEKDAERTKLQKKQPPDDVSDGMLAEVLAALKNDVE